MPPRRQAVCRALFRSRSFQGRQRHARPRRRRCTFAPGRCPRHRRSSRKRRRRAFRRRRVCHLAERCRGSGGGRRAGGRKIGRILAEPYSIEGNEVHISASIGISRYTPDVVGPDAMMIQADLALYRAKEDGRNCFRFHSADLDREVQERVVIADELRGAIERNELELHYQPQVELRSGRIVGMEALLRWNHPTRGQYPAIGLHPDRGAAGQIQALGQWVLDAACRQLRLWRDAGHRPRTRRRQFLGLAIQGLGRLSIATSPRASTNGASRPARSRSN